MLDPVQLRTLTAVLQHGSFAAAATELSYTPSAVSQQMATLERSCGVKLFERFPHGITPTWAATALAARATDILTELAAAQRDLDALARGATGRIRIGSFPTAGARIVPAALRAFSAAHPDTEVHLDEAEPGHLAAAVAAGDLDVALLYRYDLVPAPRTERLQEVELLTEALYLLMALDHRCAASNRDVGMSTLRDERWVAPLTDSPGALNLERLCAASDFSPRISFRSNDYSVVRGLAAAGLGVAVVPELAVVDDPGVHARRLAGHPGQVSRGRRVVAVHRSSDRSPLVRPMIEALRAAAAAVPPPSRS